MSEPIRIEVAGEAAPFRKKTMSWQAKDGRSGTHAYDEKKYSAWKDLARFTANRVMNGRPPLEGSVIFKVRVFLPIPESWSAKQKHLALRGIRRPGTTPDWDNLGKAAGDALEMIVFRNDKQIVHGEVDKWYSDRPRVELEVSELDLVLLQQELALHG